MKVDKPQHSVLLRLTLNLPHSARLMYPKWILPSCSCWCSTQSLFVALRRINEQVNEPANNAGLIFCKRFADAFFHQRLNSTSGKIKRNTPQAKVDTHSVWRLFCGASIAAVRVIYLRVPVSQELVEAVSRSG
ncbi:hypothetical protein CBL_05572 [Carabus blaptoides fortunei]